MSRLPILRTTATRRAAWMILLLCLDLSLKAWVRERIPIFSKQTLWAGWLELTYVPNRGMSFNLLSNLPNPLRQPIVSLISLLALGVLCWFWRRESKMMNSWMHAAFVCIFAGALGNLLERLYHGEVTDYLHLLFAGRSLFVNNFADILISVGVPLYAWGLFQTSREERVSEAKGSS